MARDQRDNEESDCFAASTFAESYIRHNVGTDQKFCTCNSSLPSLHFIDLNLKNLSGTRDKVYAVPRDLSSKVEPISRLNKNLKLRNSPMGLVPDSYTNIELLETNLAKAKEMLKHSHI